MIIKEGTAPKKSNMFGWNSISRRTSKTTAPVHLEHRNIQLWSKFSRSAFKVPEESVKPVPESWDVTMGLIQNQDRTMTDHNIQIVWLMYDRYTMTNV